MIFELSQLGRVFARLTSCENEEVLMISLYKKSKKRVTIRHLFAIKIAMEVKTAISTLQNHKGLLPASIRRGY